jgi:hypothetical protein
MGSYRLSCALKQRLSNVDELQLLVGISADAKFLQQVTYITLTHDPKILQIDTCRAYHSGPVTLCTWRRELTVGGYYRSRYRDGSEFYIEGDS